MWVQLAIITCTASATLQVDESVNPEIFSSTDGSINSSVVDEILQFIGFGRVADIIDRDPFFWYRNETYDVVADIDNDTFVAHKKSGSGYESCDVSKADPESYTCAVNSRVCKRQPISGFVQRFSRPSTYLLHVATDLTIENNDRKPKGGKPASENCTLTCAAKRDYEHEMKSTAGETVYLTCISPWSNVKRDVTFSWRREIVEFVSSYEGGDVSSLEFKPVKKDDEGLYICCVEWKEESERKSRCYGIFLSVRENKTVRSTMVEKSDSSESEYVVGVLGENFTLSCEEAVPSSSSKIPPAEQKSATVIFVILVCSTAFVLVNVGLVVFFYKRKLRSNRTIVKQIVVRIKTSPRDKPEEARHLPEVRIETQRSTKTRRTKSASAWQYELPLDEKWEFPRQRLDIVSDLGVGNFGKVMMARATSLVHDGIISTVAVKTLKDYHTDSDVVDLVKEMEIMKIIGKHENVVNFLGCCTRDGPLYVIIEYAERGSLLNFLRQHRPENEGYELPVNLDLKSKEKLSQKCLISFAYQIARGMEYLSSNRCIHRDLAARNILVSASYVMKIADFGLARDIGTNDYYRKTDDCRLPVRWMAPECINVRKFSSQSDVWSFGILLWEIMTLGEVPYPTYTKLDQLFEMIKQGGRMDRPLFCSPEVYKIMLVCWSWNPDNRPSFSDLVIRFDNLLTQISDKKYIELEPVPIEKFENKDENIDCKNEDGEESNVDETIFLTEGESLAKKDVFYQNISQVFSDGGFSSDHQEEKSPDEARIRSTDKIKSRKGRENADSNYLELLVTEDPKEK